MADLASEHVLARGCPIPANSLRPRTRPPTGGSCYVSPQRYLQTAFTHRYPRLVLVRAGSPGDETPATKEKPLNQNTEFGYSRKDVILIGVGLIALGYALYYGVQALGVEAGMAGNFVQLAVFLGIFIGYIGTYFYRVANKKMTYVQQLEDYEAAVMEKRLQEMTEGEVERMMEEVEKRKGNLGERP